MKVIAKLLSNMSVKLFLNIEDYKRYNANKLWHSESKLPLL